MPFIVCIESTGKGEGPKSGSGTQHAIVCALGQIGRLLLQLVTAAQPLLVSGEGVAVGGDSPAPLIRVLDQVLIHPSLAVRWVWLLLISHHVTTPPH